MTDASSGLPLWIVNLCKKVQNENLKIRPAYNKLHFLWYYFNGFLKDQLLFINRKKKYREGSIMLMATISHEAI